MSKIFSPGSKTARAQEFRMVWSLLKLIPVNRGMLTRSFMFRVFSRFFKEKTIRL